MTPPDDSDTWLGLCPDALPTDRALAWAGRPNCGAVVAFFGNARDHAPGRPSVTRLEYEAYDEQVVARLDHVARTVRERWPEIGRLVMLHRTGVVEIGDSAVIVIASAPHRAEAFDAARFAIDELKSTAPIWKRETWAEGTSWGVDVQHIREVEGGTR